MVPSQSPGLVRGITLAGDLTSSQWSSSSPSVEFGTASTPVGSASAGSAFVDCGFDLVSDCNDAVVPLSLPM
ncbi:MAG: hypothetical protein LBQ75_10430 [Zoogloeaceae bacterium]|nr:hypothetical protein [Zoogloeaceae bacterium]